MQHVQCAMGMPVTAWKHVHFTVEWVGRSTRSPQYNGGGGGVSSLLYATPPPSAPPYVWPAAIDPW